MYLRFFVELLLLKQKFIWYVTDKHRAIEVGWDWLSCDKLQASVREGPAPLSLVPAYMSEQACACMKVPPNRDRSGPIRFRYAYLPAYMSEQACDCMKVPPNRARSDPTRFRYTYLQT